MTPQGHRKVKVKKKKGQLNCLLFSYLFVHSFSKSLLPDTVWNPEDMVVV